MTGTVEVGTVGYPPVLTVAPSGRPPEQEIYEKLWETDTYRKHSPGEHAVQTFLAEARPKQGSKVLDLGCGTGRGGFMLAVLGNMDVTFVDFAKNALDADIVPMLETQSHVMRFVQADLTKPLPVMAEYGYCCDVMEHIGSDDVGKVIDNILHSCQHVFFQIATEDDTMGVIVGHRLHLSVHPFEWWLEQFQKRDCVIHWSKKEPGAALFYLTAWSTGHAVVDFGILNVGEEVAKKNVKANTALFPIDIKDEKVSAALLSWLAKREQHGRTIMQCFDEANLPFDVSILEALKYGPFEDSDDEARLLYWWGNSNLHWPMTMKQIEQALLDGGVSLEGRRWQQITPHQTNDEEVMILGGGPSLAEFEDEIAANRKQGMKLVTLNGAYNWCLERGISVSAQIVVDARQHNARFTKPVIDATKYMIASQCDPETFKDLPVARTYIWHTTANMVRDILNERYPVWYGVPGGSTVLLRAIPLLRMLGFHQFHLYGCDSCVAKAGPQFIDHAYPQPENPAEKIIPVNVGGKIFMCYGWHVAQAQEFIDLIKWMGHEIDLNIPGNGLLAHILNHGASEFDKSVFLQ